MSGVERFNVSNRLLMITGKGATDTFDLRNRKVVLADDYDALARRVAELEAALQECGEYLHDFVPTVDGGSDEAVRLAKLCRAALADGA